MLPRRWRLLPFLQWAFLNEPFKSTRSGGRHVISEFDFPLPGDIRQGIKGFLAAQSCQQARVQICSRCGRKMEFTEATFWMDGEDERFTIRVPVCRCTVEQGPRRNDLGPCEA